MESASTGSVVADSTGTVVSAKGQWRNSSLRSATQDKDGEKRRRPPVSKTKIFRGRVSTNPARDRARAVTSTPLMVADFLFRKQIEWLVENTGVRDDFKDVAQKIWFSYLSHYMPDLKDGVERELAGLPYWHLAFPRVELLTLLKCSHHELSPKLTELQNELPPDRSGRRITRLTRDYGRTKVSAIKKQMESLRPSSNLLVAIIALALHICQEEYLLSDILRWTRMLKLPLNDLAAFRDTASSVELRGLSRGANALHGIGRYSIIERKVTFMAATLSNDKVFLLPSLPVAPFAERFTEELNLPLEMIPMVLDILERINSLEYRLEVASQQYTASGGYRRGKNMESLLMSCIYFALRLLFVLDDQTEDRIGEATASLQELHVTARFFDFRVWYQHLMHRRALLFKHTMLSRQTYSADSFASFTRSNLLPNPPTKTIQRCGNWGNLKTKHVYQSLQRSFRRLPVPVGNTSPSIYIDLPLTVRPYRAHTEVLSQHYPELAVDFSRHTIRHLLDNQSWPGLNSNHDAAHADTQAIVHTIREAQKSGHHHTQMFRLFKSNIDKRKKLVEEDNLSRVTRDLIRTMADMIDQTAVFLLGHLVFLELVFFPKNSLCKKHGKGRTLVKVLKTV